MLDCRQRSPGALDVLRLMLPFKRAYWVSYTFYMVGLTVSVVTSGVLIPLCFRSFIDSLIKADAASSAGIAALAGGSGDVWHLLGVIALLSLLNVAALTVTDTAITLHMPYVIRDTESAIFKTIHRLSYSFFSEAFVGSLVARARRFSEGTDELDIHITRGIYVVALQFTLSVAVVAAISWILAGIFLVWAVLFVAVTLPLIRWKMRYDVAKSQADSMVTAHLADGIANFSAVKLFSRFVEEHDEFFALSSSRAEALKKSWLVTTVINTIQGSFSLVMQIAMLAMALMLWQRGAITVGTVVLAQSYLLIISNQLVDLGNRLKAIQRTTAQCVEMASLFGLTPEVRDPVEPKTPQAPAGEVSMHAISFTYPNGSQVFSDFSLHIPPGQKVGLVGYSGSGKSTLTRLLLRLADVQKGSITIDGHDIREMLQDELRRHVSYVPQDTILFHRSIAQNIGYARPGAGIDEIREAARLAYADGFIEKLPNGYDTIVGERGIKLSGGERQRIALARALLKQAPILILDEATSSLDSQSEQFIQRALEKLLQKQTAIVVAHRLSTIERLDRIVVLDDGRIVQDGTHEELLRENGLYRTLQQHQWGGVIIEERVVA